MASPKVVASRAKPGWAASVWKYAVGSVSAAAAMVSILSNTNSIKSFLDSPKKSLMGIGPEARWAGVTPSADTATSLGDSIQLALTVTDARGTTLNAVTPVWTSSDEAVARVDEGGTVVARGPGVATIVVTVGRVAARSKITVRQVPAAIQLRDSVLRIPEGERTRPVAGLVDARGARIAGAGVQWRTSDAAIVSVDSLNQLAGMTPGEATLTAVSGALQATLPVEVLAVPASITVVAGDNQRAAAGRPLATPVTAQVVSRSGRPVPGVRVEFRTPDGQGSSSPSVDTSDARGTVQTLWTLGDTPGRQHLGISTEGVSVLPLLTAEADPLPARTRVALVSEDLAGEVGDTLNEPVVIRVTDSAGVALADLPATWTTPDGGAVVALGSRTDSLGEARARWTLGPRAGRQRIQVQIGNARTMPLFTARASGQSGPVASLSARSGDGQTGSAGEILSQPVIVRTTDRTGNAVSQVWISILPKAGSVPDSSARTDSSGQARVRWTLGQAAGVQHLVLRVGGSTADLDLTAHARARGAARLSITPVRSTESGHAVVSSLVVGVTDRYGNPVAGQKVRLRVSGGTVAPASPVTDAKGQAQVRWSLGKKSAKRSLSAEVAGTDARATLTLP
jgi:hypothetical protein